MEFRNLLRAARRRWKAIVAMFVVGLVAAGVVTWLMPTKYQSTARIYISVDTSMVSEMMSASVYLTNRVTSYADLATHREVMTRVVDELDLEKSPEQLASQITSEAETGTVILDLTVSDSDPARAQAIAEVGSEQLAGYIEELETPRGDNRSQVIASITHQPTQATSPTSPRVPLNLAAGGVLGLILGIALAATREVLDTTVKSAEDIEELTEVPVMASVNTDRRVPREPLLTDVTGFSPRGEAFRLLRTNLQYLDLDSRPKALVISSAVAAEGKTHTATNLAIALAQTGQRVLLVDGDLRKPRVAQNLGLDRSVGLTGVLVGHTSLDDGVQVHEPSGMHCLPSGPTPPNPTEVLQTDATRDLLTRLRDLYDTVIIDAPPVLPVADATILGTIADGVILVTRYGRTPREELAAAAQRLRGVGGRVYGVVVNMLPKRAADGYQYYYYAQAPGTRAAGSRRAGSRRAGRAEAQPAGSAGSAGSVGSDRA